MPHITLPERVPGLLGLFEFRPETAAPLAALAEALLRGPSKLTRGERELIAAFVSERNGCSSCAAAHSACARAQLADPSVVGSVRIDYRSAPISAKLKALLALADRVRQDGRQVGDLEVAAARREGASDQEIHDAVLIAAAFSMYNRYVDGLGTWSPPDGPVYDEMALQTVTTGYAALPPLC